ncbi:MAG: hypothetical protein SFX18_00955 [Pirellulales bacterium]|nr:hypothetical protein [Pirellulales bacterium]
MKAEYDLSKLKSRKNPFASRLKKSVTVRLTGDILDYFQQQSQESGIPCQSQISL